VKKRKKSSGKAAKSTDADTKSDSNGKEKTKIESLSYKVGINYLMPLFLLNQALMHSL
jgi:hypothetical protein